MTSIDPTSQLTALIRSQLGSIGKVSVKTSSDSRAKNAPKAHGNKSQKKDVASLVASRVQLIAADDQQAGRKAFRIFLEAVLLAELGENLANDPGFYRLLDEIQQQMENNAKLAPLLKQSSELLLAARIT